MQLKELYIRGKNRLQRARVSEPAIEASSLLANAAGVDKISIYSSPEMQIDEKSGSRFDEFISRRIKGEPNAYITGIKEFYSKKFLVDKDVLIPRPETELIVEEALKIIPDTGEYFVADVCSGSGCIGITLSSIKENIKLVSIDISFPAARIAGINAEFNQVDSEPLFVNANFLDCIKERFLDMVVCNPPYVADGDFFELQRGVKDFEPRQALVSSQDGLWHIKKIVEISKNKLKNGGWLIIEIGKGQSQETAELLKLCGYGKIDISFDINNIERVVKAQWNES